MNEPVANARWRAAKRVAVFCLVLLVVAAAWSKPEPLAGETLDRSLRNALLTFATARALNAGISLIQSAQVGVGVSVHPGELLDPVNDLVERFSDVMLVAAAALGVQKVLLSIGGHWVAAAAVTAVSLIWLLVYASGRAHRRWFLQLCALLLLVRFAVPVAALGSEALFNAFLASDYRASQQAIDRIRGQAEAAAPSGAPGAEGGASVKPQGILEDTSRLWERARNMVQAADQIAEHVIRLIVIFLLQTVGFPLALLGLLYALMRALVNPR